MTKTSLNLEGCRILVVDDVPDNVNILLRTLEEVGYEVQIASTGEKGLELAARSNPDLILMDVMMPGIDGYETCRRLKQGERTQDIPVIFLTALDAPSDVVAGFRAGGVDFVAKPFRKGEVLVRVQTHLERAHLIRALGQKRRALADLNAQLEQKVAARTQELQLKIQESENRDRAAQHLLGVFKQHQTLKVLSSTRLFQDLDEPTLRDLAAELETVFLPGGDRLFQQGDTGDALYVILNGRLRVVVQQEDGQDKTVGEVGQGESVGEMAILTEETRSASVYAVRDSNLIKLSKPGFNRFKQQHPGILEQVIQLLIRRIRERDHPGASGRTDRGTSVALVAADQGVPVTQFAVRLAEALSKTGSALHLNANHLDRYLGEGTAQTSQMDLRNRNLVAWLNEQEMSKRFVVYETDPSPSPWTGRCLRQADLIFIIGRAGGNPQQGALETAMLQTDRSNLTARTELILLHPDGSQRPVNTRAWLASRDVTAHHHIRLTAQPDFERLARTINGQTVGLVLSGGAARGFAHIGVIRALREEGIPIDMIGGTSMGSVVAAQYALGLGYKAMLAANRDGWAKQNPFSAYTFPMIALLNDRKFNNMLKGMFGTAQVEDLWLPFFCVSSNLTRAEEKTHRGGMLWKGIRASVSVPGALPPLFQGGDIYVDGAVLNNLPTDVMRRFRDGYVIASDASVDVEMETNPPEYENLSGWRLLFDRLNPAARSTSVPSLMNVIVRSAELSSAQNTERQRQEADFFLRPPVRSFERFAWHAVEEIAEAGYAYTQKKLEEWPFARSG